MRFKPYPKYKPSGVEWLGDVPEHWEITRLKRTSDVRLSNVDKHTVEGQQVVKLCNYVDVYKNDRITSEIDFMVASASDEQIARLTLARDDVIITKDSETPSDIGVPALVDEEIPDLVCGYHLALVRPTSSSGKYLSYLFQSHVVRAIFEVEATGMTRYALGKYSIENLPFASPEVEEQSAISSFLDRETAKIDTLIAKQEKLIELLKEKRQAIISHAVTKGLNPNVKMKDSGIEWLGEVPEHWGVISVKRICDVRDGTHDTPSYVEQSESSYPLVTSKDLSGSGVSLEDAKHISQDDYLQIAKRSNVESGDLLMPMIGSIGGAVVVDIDDKFAIKNVALFRKNSHAFDSEWLKLVLNSDFVNLQFDLNRSGGVQGFVGLETLRNLVTPYPSLEEQRELVGYVGKIDTQLNLFVTKAEQAITLQKEHRAALISAAVTGKIDVREAV